MDDFNIDLLKYDMHGDSFDFLDAMYASFLLPYISAPSRVTRHSKTLNDNIFSNMIEDGSISVNFVTVISDHYDQFLLIKKLNNKKKILQIQRYIIRTSKRLMRKDWEMIYKILAGTMLLNYIVKTLTNHLKLLLAPLSLSLIDMHH